MAQSTALTDLDSIRIIMDAEANILEGMADLFCNVLVGRMRSIVATETAPTANEVERQVSDLKKILCGYTAKENAIANVIAAVTKKEAADLGISPDVVCKCLACECKKDC
jgi:hypothetical protein